MLVLNIRNRIRVWQY